MQSWKYALFVSALALAACGNPEKSAESSLDKASKAWADEAGDLDPVKRAKTYDSIIKDVEGVGKKYPKTTYGMAIAAGRSAGGVSIAEMKQKRDALAERAACYANPTVECLRPFGSRANSGQMSGAADSSNAFADAEKLICDKNFAAADKALDSFKINKAAYSKELIQVALAGAQCDKPNDVKAAVDAYLAAEPLQGAQRAQALLSILATDQLQPGWPAVTAELEKDLQSGGLDQNSTASIVLTLAVHYAQAGDAKAALEKYSYFTDTLHYQADWQSKREVGAGLILAGDAESGLKIGTMDNNPSTAVITAHEAAASLGRRMGLIDQSAALPNSTVDLHAKDIDDYFSPVDASEKAQDEKAADALEATLDQMAPTASAQNQAIGLVGLDEAYGIVALVRQKLGQPDKAAAAMKKGEDLRARLLGAVDANVEYDNFASFQTLVALGRNDPSAAADYAAKAGLRLYSYPKLILEKAGQGGDAEKALAVYAKLNGLVQDYQAFSAMIAGLTKAGKSDQIDKLIDAYPGNPADKANFYWPIVDGLVAQGDADGAKKYADKHGLISDPQSKLRLDSSLMNSDKIAGNRGKAEPIIREMFQIGQDMDAAGGLSYAGGADRYIAQNAARTAFEKGYTDLGIELYKDAKNKDQRPLLYAFVDKMKPREMTPVLMLAQDNLSGEHLGYVIDAAMRHLQKS